MSYSRPGCLIDCVNGRRAGGYRRHPEVTNHPDPADYPSPAEYQWAKIHRDDEPNRETVESPWYAFAYSPSDDYFWDEFRYWVEELSRIRSEKSWQEITGYDRAAPSARAQLRMIVDEFLFEYSNQKENERIDLVIS